jgi:hypothetical protein
VGRHEQIPSATATTKNHQPARETLVYQSSRFEVPCGSSVSSFTYLGVGLHFGRRFFFGKQAPDKLTRFRGCEIFWVTVFECNRRWATLDETRLREHRIVLETIHRISVVHPATSAHIIRRRILKADRLPTRALSQPHRFQSSARSTALFDGSFCTLCLAGHDIPVIATTSATLARPTHSRLLTSDFFFLLDSSFFAAATNQLRCLFECELI